MTSPRTQDEFVERFLYPLTNADDEVELVEPGMMGGWLVEFIDGTVWGLRIDLVQRGDDLERGES